jgi:hypothetical protein
MIHGQNDREVILICDGEVTNDETSTGLVDTLGYDQCIISVYATTSNATTNNFTTLKLSEGQDTSNWTAIANFTGDDTTDGFTIPTADTSDPQVVAQLSVDLKKRERYLLMTITPLTSQALTVVARLSQGDETPVGATALGVGVQKIA